MLHVIDQQWKDNLLSMDHLKEGIGLRGYGQKDPLVEYKKESYILFQDLMDRIEDETVRFLFFLQVQEGERPRCPSETRRGIRRGAARRRRRSRCWPAAPAAAARRPEHGRGLHAQYTAQEGQGNGGPAVRRGRFQLRIEDRRPGRQSGAQRPLPLRERKEVQEMLRSDAVKTVLVYWPAACGASSALSARRAQIWLDRIGGFHEGLLAAATVQDRPLWEEYGLLQSEQAEYVSGCPAHEGLRPTA